ncbi:MAG: GntR family transcriptional regulator [Bacteroidota bacterium]
MVKLTLNDNAKRPKYLLLSDSIVEQIEKGELVLDEKLPSVNQLSRHFSFSRETVFKALNHLSEKGIVRAVDKIGYFVDDVSIHNDYKVFFMLDKFTTFKEDLFNSLLLNLGNLAKVSMYFHHQNFEIFEALIAQNLKNYTHFVITTYLDNPRKVKKVLNSIPPEKRIILDKCERNLSEGYGMVYQDFENDIFMALADNLNLVKKYGRLILIDHENAPHGDFVRTGFKKFCKEYNFEGEVHKDLLPDQFNKGNLYITIDAYDRDLVEIIKLVRAENWKLGNQIGLISYNDTTTKEILDGGITVISTDFKKMGAAAAEMILSGNLIQKQNTTNVILRNSL